MTEVCWSEYCYNAEYYINDLISMKGPRMSRKHNPTFAMVLFFQICGDALEMIPTWLDSVDRYDIEMVNPP